MLASRITFESTCSMSCWLVLFQVWLSRAKDEAGVDGDEPRAVTCQTVTLEKVPTDMDCALRADRFGFANFEEFANAYMASLPLGCIGLPKA